MQTEPQMGTSPVSHPQQAALGNSDLQAGGPGLLLRGCPQLLLGTTCGSDRQVHVARGLPLPMADGPTEACPL